MNTLGLEFDGRPLTRQELVVDRLRDAILRGQLKPGQRLDQNEIADVLSVSRSPVREALRTLAAEGLVELIPHRGAVVAELSFDEVEEIYTLRSVIEGMAARLAVPKLDSARLDRLERILGELDRTEEPDAWLQLNQRFHHTLYEAASRPRMLALIGNLRNTAAPYIREFITSPEHMREAAVGHRLILQACRDRDGAAAEQEIRKHLLAVCAGAILQARARTQAQESLAPDAKKSQRESRDRPSVVSVR